MDVDTAQIRSKLQEAVEECTTRGLVFAAKWAAEQLCSLSIDTTSSTELLVPLSLSSLNGEEEKQINNDNDQKHSERLAKWSMQDTQERDRVLLAKCMFDLREFDRAAFCLEECTGPRAMFLRLYSRFLSRERRAGEARASSSGNETGNGVDSSGAGGVSAMSAEESERRRAAGEADRELLAIRDELEAADAADNIDAFGLYLAGLVYRALGQRSQAQAVCLRSVRQYEYNWSAWQLLGTSIDLVHYPIEQLTVDLSGMGWMRHAFLAHALVERFGGNEGFAVHQRVIEQLFPQSPFVLGLIAMRHYSMREFEEAGRIFGKLDEIDPYGLELSDIHSNILFVMEDRARLGALAHKCAARSRCDGVKPACTTCVKRGLECQYLAMRKRGRHGKRSQTPVASVGSSSHASGLVNPNTTTPADAAAAAAAAVWTLPPQQITSSQPGSFNLFENIPRFLLSPEMSLASNATAAAGRHAGTIGSVGGPQLNAGSNGGTQQPSHQSILEAVLSPTHLVGSGTVQVSSTAITSALFCSVDTPAQTQNVAYGTHQYRERPPSSFLGSPRTPSTSSLSHHHFQLPPPMSVRELSTGSAAVFDSSIPTSMTGIASPIGLGTMLASTTAALGGMSAMGIAGTQSLAQQPQTCEGGSSMAAAAAAAAFQFSPLHKSPIHTQSQPILPQGAPLQSISTAFPFPQGQQIPRQKQSSDTGEREIDEEEQVLDGLRTDGADGFGRPVFDVTTYPLPGRADLDEHIDGMFEYFYMGAQTMHEATFRQRIRQGLVSPVLIYAIMAVASRYSRRPSLHSLNGMAFLNGDRHATTACGLASILLSHGDLGTVDAVHGMLFLAVYFMGQGNMLKARMYLVKAVCAARTMGFATMDATFVASNPMSALDGMHDSAMARRPQNRSQSASSGLCSCPSSLDELVELETKRRIWWFLVFVDYVTANVMDVPLEIAADSYCVRLPCSDEEWTSATLAAKPSFGRDLAFGDQNADIGGEDSLGNNNKENGYGSRNAGTHDCRPPWPYRSGAFYLERLMVECCGHLRRLNNLRSLANRTFFHTPPVFVGERYPHMGRRRGHRHVPWRDRLARVKASWSWLHLQLNRWLEAILMRFSELIHRVSAVQFSHFNRYLQQNSSRARHEPSTSAARSARSAHVSAAAPPADCSNGLLSDGLSEFALGQLGSSIAPLINHAMAMNGSVTSSVDSSYGGGGGSSGMNSPDNSDGEQQDEPHAVLDELSEMAGIAWDGCVSTAEQLAQILRGKHPRFVLLGGDPINVFHEQVLAGDANILSAPGSAFNNPGSGPGADNPILSDPDFYMRLQPSTAWWMFLVAQVQVGHIKRLLRESEGSFKIAAKRKAYIQRMAGVASNPQPSFSNTESMSESAGVPPATTVDDDLSHDSLQRPCDEMRPLSTSVNNSAAMLAMRLTEATPLLGTAATFAAESETADAQHRADIKSRAARLICAYENLSCMVKILEGMQQYWQCMDYVSAVQNILKGSEHPLY
ncbi:Anaphase-promoting complex subunit 8 [Coemansia sp. RSA 1365]|nr:Anaphase-promoting complex subunit 8 [Coemansia sp. RSA 1365]